MSNAIKPLLLPTILRGYASHHNLSKLWVKVRVKIRPGRLYSRDKVDKPKRHHVFRRVC
ncbi:hypothetical protein [Wolbachia endosymbiont of Phyllotreta cruciferae]|uniref:hypothetical protein n=1 Tax=Wolbachia endosymbiont of Phyllotreta cruciferae TaxID=2886377 RepID=UPI0020A11C54|nr:hypothetical protein [Wolbachia endosymbiont of Phyllotreta cruciferae]